MLATTASSVAFALCRLTSRALVPSLQLDLWASSKSHLRFKGYFYYNCLTGAVLARDDLWVQDSGLRIELY